jgi:hypothetical protein
MNSRTLLAQAAAGALLLAAFLTPALYAQNTMNWAGAPGVPLGWNDPSNWTTTNGLNPIPTTPDIALINNGGIASLDATMFMNPGSVTLGSTGGTSGRINMSGGSLTLSNTDLRIGGNSATAAAGTGYFEQTGGDIVLSGGGNVNVGIGTGALGTYTISAGSLSMNFSNIMAVANRSIGDGVQPGGTVIQTGGTVYIRGSTSNFGAAIVQLGRNVAATPASGSYTLSGGKLAVANFRFGNAVGTTGVSNNTLTLSGTGELIVKEFTIINTAANNVFNFTGGTLRAQTIGFPITNAGGTLSPSNPLFNGLGDISALAIDPVTTMTFQLNYGYTQTAAGHLALDLRDALSYDIVDVGGNGTGVVSLGGFVDVNPLTGFDPGLGTIFDVVKADALTFTGQVVGQTPSGNLFQPSIVIGSDSRQVLRLTVVPEPASASLALTAAIALISSRRRTSRS